MLHRECKIGKKKFLKLTLLRKLFIASVHENRLRFLLAYWATNTQYDTISVKKSIPLNCKDRITTPTFSYYFCNIIFK